MMKYYIGELDIRNGEYQYHATIKFQIEDNLATPQQCLRTLASTYYGDEVGELDDGDDGAYYFNGGEVCVDCGNWQEIDKQTFDALTLIVEL